MYTILTQTKASVTYYNTPQTNVNITTRVSIDLITF